MQAIQNFMGFVTDIHDLITPHTHLNNKDAARTCIAQARMSSGIQIPTPLIAFDQRNSQTIVSQQSQITTLTYQTSFRSSTLNVGNMALSKIKTVPSQIEIWHDTTESQRAIKCQRTEIKPMRRFNAASNNPADDPQVANTPVDSRSLSVVSIYSPAPER
jgi:hypothetical protein